MPYVSLDNFNMYFDDCGKGEPIIFIHGSLSFGMETFKKQDHFFENDYRCICIDLRSHGKSKCEELTWNTESLSEDIIELMNKLHIEKAHLIGHSMGGDVAMYCAVKHSDRVKSVTAISTAGMVNRNISSYLEQLSPDVINEVKFAKFIEKMQDLYGEWWKKLVNHTIWNCNNYPRFLERELKQIRMPFFLIRGN